MVVGSSPVAVSNYIPNEALICDGKDPPWINKKVKQLFSGKQNAYKFTLKIEKTLQYLLRVKVFKIILPSQLKMTSKNTAHVCQKC